MSLYRLMTINGTEYRARRAIIERTHFGTADHGGVMTIELGLSYPDGGAGITRFGGHALDAPTGRAERLSTAYGMDTAVKVMAAAGASHWEAVQGSECLALFPAATEGNPDDFWAAHPAGITATGGAHPYIPEAHAAFWAESEAPAPLPSQDLAGHQLPLLPAGSAVAFIDRNDNTAGVAICGRDGRWSATGFSKSFDDFGLWTRSARLTFLGSAPESA
ncbi:hypothetical protein [Arthrobacter sp. IK3]|uniref:hypothetical protein n=1 Tax=Arthrobacter sp. IK3 TaxID=3448169 RepID=UPI003EE2E53F